MMENGFLFYLITLTNSFAISFFRIVEFTNKDIFSSGYFFINNNFLITWKGLLFICYPFA